MCCHCPIAFQLPTPNCCPLFRFAKFILDHQTEYLRVKIFCKQRCLGKYYTNLWTWTNCNVFGPKKIKENLHCIIPVSLWNFLFFPIQIFPKCYNYSPIEPRKNIIENPSSFCVLLLPFSLSSFFIWTGVTFLLVISLPPKVKILIGLSYRCWNMQLPWRYLIFLLFIGLPGFF